MQIASIVVHTKGAAMLTIQIASGDQAKVAEVLIGAGIPFSFEDGASTAQGTDLESSINQLTTLQVRIENSTQELATTKLPELGVSANDIARLAEAVDMLDALTRNPWGHQSAVDKLLAAGDNLAYAARVAEGGGFR